MTAPHTRFLLQQMTPASIFTRCFRSTVAFGAESGIIHFFIPFAGNGAEEFTFRVRLVGLKQVSVVETRSWFILGGTTQDRLPPL